MSAQQLADECAALGHAIPRSVLANLESGRRETVSVPELLVIAQALNVAPILLLFPLGYEPDAEVRPGCWTRAWDAAEWFAGRRDVPPAPLHDDKVAVGEPVYRRPVELYEAYERAQETYRRAQVNTRRWRERARTENGDVAESLAQAEEQEADAMVAITHLRYVMREAGILPPPATFEEDRP